MSAAEAIGASGDVAGGLPEAQRLSWRRPASDATLRRDGRHWTRWTFFIVLTFAAPSAALLLLSPWTFPAALLWSGHGYAICRLQARRGARSVVAIGSERSAARRGGAHAGAEKVGLGLLGDLLDHRERELLQESGLALQPGRLGVWLLGENGAILVRPGGRRVFCWCVKVGDAEELPAGDRVAHLLLALREDEMGFATVANLGFSGALWRVRARMGERERIALAAAREQARSTSLR